MLWGQDECPDTPVMLGPNELQIVKTTKHVGVSLVSEDSMILDTYRDRIATARKALFSVRGVGSNMVPVTPVVM